jgi:SAM-dependent methyltransferase
MDLKESALLGDDAARHWYYRSKAAAMTRCLAGSSPRRVLDVGAGSAFFSRHLLQHAAVSSAVCVDTGYDADRDELCFGKALSFRRELGADEADLVLLMDVLEHVDDDAALLSAYAAKVGPDTLFLITVPAHQWLWSEHDVFLEHRRRYSVEQLEAVVRRTGLRVVRGSYYFGLVMPIAAAARWGRRLLTRTSAEPRSQLVRHGALTNGVLAGLCRAELPMLPFNRLAGLSVFCLATKG